MQFNEIGEQLRAFRQESGLRAEEIAARIGVSRAALYRYEKGEVIKLDTVKRLAELLKISPLALLGVGIEYYSRSAGFLERLRQVEETADQILQVEGPVSYLITSEDYDSTLRNVFAEIAERAAPAGQAAALRATAEQVLRIVGLRKRSYRERRPAIIALLSAPAVERFLAEGVAGSIALSEPLRRRCRDIAAGEIERIVSLIESEPIGLQFGLLPGPGPVGAFMVLRGRDRSTLALNPFRLDVHPLESSGVAMIIAAEEPVAAHQRAAELLWQGAAKGAPAVARLREMLAAVR
ncbi:MAG: helix-turn-helix domain-containing protein [Acetobacteraceae bacterium]